MRAFVLAVVCLSAEGALAQNTTFNYQGRLANGGTPASGVYDFEFRLFNAVDVQLGTALFKDDVSVVDGTFTVTLDFGSAPFASGAASTLEVRVRAGASTGGFTQLLPRHQLNATPYAVRSLGAATADSATNAAQLGGTAASQYVLTGDARLSDARAPTAGSANYVQNTTSPQAGNMNLTGNATIGGTLASNQITTQGSVGVAKGLPLFRLDVGAGPSWTADFWSASIGMPNVSALGWSPNTQDRRFGIGQTNDGLRIFQTSANPGQTVAAALNQLLLHNSGNVGVAKDLPNFRLDVGAGAFWTTDFWSASIGVPNASALGWSANTSSRRFGIGQTNDGLRIFHTTVDPGQTSAAAVSDLRIDNNGTVIAPVLSVGSLFVQTLLVGGNNTDVCRDGGSNEIVACASSLRYKDNVQTYPKGLSIVGRLRPITFDWKADGVRDLGFAAEEVAAIEPLLVTPDQDGAVLGVKYRQLTTVLVNAINEQQAQIDELKAQVSALTAQVDRLVEAARARARAR